MRGVVAVPAEVLGFLAENWMLLVGLFTVGLLAYWVFDERDDAGSPGELVEGVGERAESVTAGFLDATSSLLIVLASIALTIGAELLQTFGALNELLGHMPWAIGYALFSVLTFAGLGGYLPLTFSQLGMACIVIAIIAVVVKYGPDGSGSGA